MTAVLRAGAAREPLAPPLGTPMMGYALRAGPAEAELDPLFARALFVQDAGAGDPGLLLVVLDVCLLAVSQAQALRSRIAAATGVPAERTVVCCTHTHSGPETGLAAALEGRAAPPHVAPLLGAAVRAAARAVEGAEPARLGAAQGEAAIGRNRADAGGAVDRSVTVVRVDRTSGAPLALLYVHGCHPTVLGHDHRAWSADWPGAASRAIEAAWPGALAIFALGAHADVDPRTRGLQDIALEGRSAGASPAEMEALGAEVGEAAARAAADARPDAAAPAAIASAQVELAVPGGEGGEAARSAWLARRRADALAALGLPAEADVPARDLFRLAHERSRGLPPDAARDRIGRVRLYLRDRQAPGFAGGLRARAEVQALRLGPAALLALPFEASAAVGLDWRERVLGGEPPGAGPAAPPGLAHAAVLSIANGWLRYLPHPAHFAAPRAHHRYDVLTSNFGPDAAARLLEAGEALLGRWKRH